VSPEIRARLSQRRETIRDRRKLDLVYRLAVALVGLAIVVAGLLLLPLPGPGWLIIFAGLGLLATEFTWARRLLDFAREQVGRWSAWVRRQSLAVRSALGLAFIAIVAVAGFGYVAWRGVPDWLPGIG
jgi:uncharacterized protein (TIGR02611 family)